MKYISSEQKGIAHVAAVLIVIVLAVIGAVGYKVWKQSNKSAGTKDSASNQTQQAAGDSPKSAAKTKISATEEGILILDGGYADPTIAKTAAGFRMYVNRQSNGPGGYLTYTSADGKTWTKEHDIIISGVATGRAVQLPEGIRFYYPGVQPINPADPPADMFSSFSTDGVTFTKDPGVILKPRSDKYYVEGPTVFQLPNKSWRMYFNENSIAAANQRDGEIWGATSQDGLTWTRDDEPTLTAEDVESKPGGKQAPWKQVLHPFVLVNPKGGYIMLYNSHSEIFAATSADGLTWEKLGEVGIHGADVDGYFEDDNTIRIYYGDFDPKTGGKVFMGVLKVE